MKTEENHGSQTDQDFSLSNRIKELSKPLLESIPIDLIKNFTHHNLKFFVDHYIIKFNTDRKNHDVLVRIHTNGTILVSIAKGHDIIRNNKKIASVDFGDNNNVINKKFAKSKRAAPIVGSNSVLCRLKCEGEEITYPIYMGVRSRLIEINENVFKDPNVLITSYKNLGYLAVLQPQVMADGDMKKNLLNEENYHDYLESKST